MSQEPPITDSGKIQLQGGLHQRHLTMIALGA
jgi:amino acid permease